MAQLSNNMLLTRYRLHCFSFSVFFCGTQGPDVKIKGQNIHLPDCHFT